MSKRKSPSSSSLSLLSLFHRRLAGSAGEVFSFGSGDCSQLGLGADDNMRERKKPTPLKSLAEYNIVFASAGSLHNAVIDESGSIHTWGCNDDFALGHEEDEWLPHKVRGPLGDGSVKAAQVLCGSSHSVALTGAGDVYAFGSYRDSSGLMGFSDSVEQAKEPIQLKDLKSVVQIACGDDHDLALTSSGLVYQWGDIGVGQRASDRNKKSKLKPRLVTFKKSGAHSKPRIVAVFAGGHASFGLTADGVVWAWGPNNYRQLGIENESKDSFSILIPTPIPNLPPISKVAAGTHHSLFLAVDGRVFSVGRGEDGRLGHGVAANCDSPKEIAGLKLAGDKVIDIACSESHSMAITANGRLFTFGYGDLLQLGNGVEEDSLAPYRVTSKFLDEENRAVIQASAGSQHSLILTAKRQSPAIPDSAPEKSRSPKKAKVESEENKSNSNQTAAAAAAAKTKSGDFDSQVTAADEAELPEDDDGF